MWISRIRTNESVQSSDRPSSSDYDRTRGFFIPIVISNKQACYKTSWAQTLSTLTRMCNRPAMRNKRRHYSSKTYSLVRGKDVSRGLINKRVASLTLFWVNIKVNCGFLVYKGKDICAERRVVGRPRRPVYSLFVFNPKIIFVIRRLLVCLFLFNGS